MGGVFIEFSDAANLQEARATPMEPATTSANVRWSNAGVLPADFGAGQRTLINIPVYGGLGRPLHPLPGTPTTAASH